MRKILTLILATACLMSCRNNAPASFSGAFDLDSIRKVCDAAACWQMSHFSSVPKSDSVYIIHYQVHWSAGVMYAGMFDWANYSGNNDCFKFLKKVGDNNGWDLFNHRPYHADDICVGQMYLKMGQKFGRRDWMQSTIDRAFYIASHPSQAPLSKKDFIGQYERWSWCDAIFMAPPVYAELYRLTGEKVYLDYLENEFRTCADSLFDRQENLFARDCIRRECREPNGQKEFWARGNAWVFAGIPLTLNNLPQDSPVRPLFEEYFLKMAPSVLRCQGEDGSWRPSMLDPEHYPTPENSSSALFCYGLAWGINHGLLSKEEYLPALEKAWAALCSHVHPDGKIGYVQPIGAFPLGGISENDTQMYAVGGLLFAGAEISRMLEAGKENTESLGLLRNKMLSETHNDLTVGCEIIDRAYSDYHKYKTYLDSLGIRKIRLQAGWARTEREKGKYDFEWLDSIIDDAVARGLEPWLQTSYGNPIYEGGGTPFLAGGWPVSQEAKDAWDAWVREMALRYKGKVHEWEIWNEPDINKEQFKDYASFVEMTVRTARIIKSVDPDAKIAAFAWAYSKPDIFDACMKLLEEQDALELIDWVTYHFYRYRPEDIFKEYDKFRAVLDRYDSDIILRQGETGAPSQGGLGGALSDNPWTEVSQAKWDLRRMMGDKARGIPTTVFTIVDFTYAKTDHITKKNVKGLLETDDDMNVVRPKLAFHAVRNLATIWDEADVPVSSVKVIPSAKGSRACQAYADKESGLTAVAVWDDSSVPSDETQAHPEELTVIGGKFLNPVCVDLLSGRVSQLETSRSGNTVVFPSLPVYDSPIMIIDRSLIDLR
ncbi:MAG: glycoside hydrolase family 88 protein [Bacteroidales bacterium]|nr:glycoside hydrolase family 88 protein [Bacteroidales bacterium]